MIWVVLEDDWHERTMTAWGAGLDAREMAGHAMYPRREFAEETPNVVQ